ncbi:hypothetical protein B0H11DRAFT_1971881 [Mycena galericulata]|nr:hypothetical protein B0H11DRAFT_1971881 [Mycena galericulata]
MPSAPTTPKASRTNSPAADSESPAKTPRKSPHCKTCGRPRKGHPLRACEYPDSPKNTTSAAGTSRANNLIDALEAMSLEERDRKEKRERRKSAAQPRPVQSLPSISTVTEELLESLKAPGLFDDNDSDYGGESAEKREVVIRWREVSGVPSSKVAGVRADPLVLPVSPPSSDESPGTIEEEPTPVKKGRSKAVRK